MLNRVSFSQSKRELGIYGLVGLVATIIYLALSFLFVNFGVTTTIASFASYSFSTSISYVGHKSFTFRSGIQHDYGIPRFILATLTGLGLSFTIPYIVTDLLLFSSTASFLIVAASVPATLFLILKFYVFRRRDQNGHRRV